MNPDEMTTIERPTFSVALATYNGEHFLREQLDSLVQQTLLPTELVVVDDRSSDATVRILHDFAAQAPFPVRVHENERNEGYEESFFRAMAACGGEWIACCDQDDWWLPEKLERCAQTIRDHSGVVLVSHSADQVDADLTPLGSRVPDHPTSRIVDPLENTPLAVYQGFSCCVRRSLLDRVPADLRPQDNPDPAKRQSHDRFIYHIANTYGQTALIAESLALYRRHGSSVTGAPGSGMKSSGTLSKLRSARHAGAGAFRHMADRARQHRKFYALVAREAEDDFRVRTLAAVRYYGEIESFYTRRAGIYETAASFGSRARAFVAAWRLGVRSGAGVVKGLGVKSAAKDLAHVVVPWSKWSRNG